MIRDRGPGAAAPPPGESGEALVREMRQLLASADPVPAQTLLAARLAFAHPPRATTAPRPACAQARRPRRARPRRRHGRPRRS